MELLFPLLPHLSFNNTLGAIEIGVIISVVLFGVFSVQAFHYFDEFENDPRFVKFMVIRDLFSFHFDTDLNNFLSLGGDCLVKFPVYSILKLC